MESAICGKVKVLTLLLDRGAVIDAKNMVRRVPYLNACALLVRRPSVVACVITPLHLPTPSHPCLPHCAALQIRDKVQRAPSPQERGRQPHSRMVGQCPRKRRVSSSHVNSPQHHLHQFLKT